MKRLLFNTTLIALLLTSIATAQTKTIYKKSFRTSSEEKFEFRVINAPIIFETSPDDQIHIDFSMDFENYTEKEIKKVVDQIKISTSSLDGFTRFQVESTLKLSKEQHTLNTKEAMVFEFDDLKGSSKKTKAHKSKDSVLKEIQKKTKNRFLNKLKIEGKDGTRKSISKANISVMKSQFIVKIPQHVFTRVQGMDSQIFIPNDITQRIDISLTKGLINAKNITHKLADLNFEDMASVQIESVQVKKLAMKDVSRALIGSINQTNCMFQGSRVEIGLVGKDIDIRDFSSKIFLYNFDPKFKELNLKGEYTELYLFDLGEHVELRAEGGGITLMMQEGDKSSEFKADMMRKMAKNSMFGQVMANIKNGILHVITDK